MSEKPILFSTPMVRAILAGRKTQTRRVMKRQPSSHHWEVLRGYQFHHKVFECHDCYAVKFWHSIPRGTMDARACDDDCWVRAPYRPGDVLWVRETWASSKALDYVRPKNLAAGFPCEYAAGGTSIDGVQCLVERGKWRPSIFMPCHASRITLTVTDVRAQRVQDISEEDAIAEGINLPATELYPDINTGSKLRWRFERLWDSINAKRGYSWGSNPWVWAYTFTVSEVKP